MTCPNSGVPTAAIVFAHDVAIRRYAEAANTITRWADVDRGGHFAALEEPDLLSATSASSSATCADRTRYLAGNRPDDPVAVSLAA